MKLPTVRVTINDAKLALMMPGLEFLAQGIASYRLQRFTARTLWESTMTPTSMPYKKAWYSEERAAFVISARQKLMARGSSRKVRLNVFDFSAMALALRIQKRLPQTKSTLAKEEVAKLEVWLENLRRRADRLTKASNGEFDYLIAKARWRSFCAWTRGHLMFKVPGRPSRAIQMIAADKRNGLRDLVTTTLANRKYEALSEADMRRVVRLLKEEFLRGRHQHTLLEFLRLDGAEAEAYLFPRLQKKLGLVALEGAEKNWCIAAAERGDRFRDLSYRAVPEQEETEPAASAVPVPPASGSDGRRNTPVAVLPKPPEPAAPPRQLDPAVEPVAAWLQREVPGRYWSNLKKLAPSLTGNRHAIHRPDTSLSEFIRLTRQAPVRIIEGLTPPGHIEHLELTRFFLWAGAFLKSFFSDCPEKVVEVFQDAYHLAVAQAASSTEAA